MADPKKLMFNRDITTKLPKFTTTPRGRHHEKARTKDRDAKQQMKTRYDAKHRTRLVEIRPGDWAYIRKTATSSIKGPWDPHPSKSYMCTKIRSPGEDGGEEKT